jgi:hypothetical protein
MSDEMSGFDSPDSGADLGTDVAISQENATPDVPEVDDNFQFRIKGQDKPLKLSEYRAGFQSQATKASQEAARLRQEVAQYKQQMAQLEAQRQQQARQAASSGQGQNQDIYAKLKELPYLDGEGAYALTQQIQQDLKQRDMILLAAAQKLQQMERVVNSLNSAHQGNAFEAKIAKYVQDQGLDPQWNDVAAKLYLAYEGDDLDAEFPTILANEVTQLERLFESRRQAKVNAARKTPFVPGRGGNTGPGQALKLDPKANARDTADQLWDMIQSGSGT